MFKRLIKYALVFVVILALSAALLIKQISGGLGAMSTRNGDWVTSLKTGSSDAGVIDRATVAISGLLASTAQNSMYYTLDSLNGEPLKLNCRYRIEGGDYATNWWSITAYGWDKYLIGNRAKRYSFNNDNLIRNDDGSWVIIVDAQEQTGNWLPIGESGTALWRKRQDNDFDLLLRLYTPDDVYLEFPNSAPLPKVIKERCR